MTPEKFKDYHGCMASNVKDMVFCIGCHHIDDAYGCETARSEESLVRFNVVVIADDLKCSDTVEKVGHSTTE